MFYDNTLRRTSSLPELSIGRADESIKSLTEVPSYIRKDQIYLTIPDNVIPKNSTKSDLAKKRASFLEAVNVERKTQATAL